MAIWMEIRCDHQSKHDHIKCLSRENNGPMQMAGSDLKSVRDTHRQIMTQARKEGWKNIGGGNWICPNHTKAFMEENDV